MLIVGRPGAQTNAILLQVDAMKVSVKEFKKEYKKINIDNIEVRYRVQLVVCCDIQKNVDPGLAAGDAANNNNNTRLTALFPGLPR